MSDPLGYLLTFRTYGTWLPGDPRGTVDSAHNVYGTRLALANSSRVTAAAAACSHEPLVFTSAMRTIVAESIASTCRHSQWALAACNVRTNHVHCVVCRHLGFGSPEGITKKLKAWCTRHLRESTLVVTDRPIWATGGSKRYLWTPADIDTACRYVDEQQDGERFK